MDPTPSWRDWSVRMLAYVLVAVLAWMLLGYILQRYALFPRVIANQPAPVPRPPDAEPLWLETEAGSVEAWLLPGRGVSAEAPGAAVMFAHGNGERIDFWPAQLQAYRQMGISVLLPEYRGYGRSAGTPSAEAILRDFARFHAMLAERSEVDPARIVFHGRSLGGVTLGTLARERRPAALILESTFTSTAAMARRYLIPRMLVRDRFDALAGVNAYAGPVLVLHGRRDTIIPPRHAVQLHEAARHGTLVWFDTNHNDPIPEARYWSAIEDFLRANRLVGAD
jgi:fermentation-respiration switch protein FrsA (DUF1100 family)